MESKSNQIIEIQLGKTRFILEFEASSTSTETAYDKVKRLILNHATDTEKLSKKPKLSA